MEIVLGETAGFCYGVKRAVDWAMRDVKENDKICALGELVHNKQVIKILEEEGLRFIEKVDEIKDENKLIIRAHGVPKEIYEFANNNGIELKDYTCPFVLKIHKLVEEYAKKGYYILLCGNESHPENIGTISYAGDNFSIINEKNVDGKIENIKKKGIYNIFLVAQTTYSMEKFMKIKDKIDGALGSENIDLVVSNTICKATGLRQKETDKISKKVDFMIIIGGKNSSNTKKLYEISLKNCINTILIETKKEINEKLKQKIIKFEKIGIMAGASTPESSIDDVIEYLKQNNKNEINV